MPDQRPAQQPRLQSVTLLTLSIILAGPVSTDSASPAPKSTASSPTQPAAHPVPTAALERLELVTDKADNGPGGNNWGGHQARIVRTQKDIFTAYTIPGQGQLARQWRLAERTPTGWQVIGQGPSGREPVNLLADPEGRPSVIAWPDGLPRIWSFSNKSGNWEFHEAEIPGDWLKTQWPYAAAATDPRGDICIMQTLGAKPGEFRWAIRTGGKWTFQKTATDYRYCYAYLLPGASGAFSVTATRDVLWKELGYQKPPGQFDYVFNAVGSWNSPNAAKLPLTPLLVREEAPSRDFPIVECSNAQGDSYRDTRGRLHVLYEIRGPSTRDQERTRQAVLYQGKVIKDVEMPFTWGTYSRIIQDRRGRFYILSAREGGSVINVYPSLSDDGTVLGVPTPLDLKGYHLTYFGLALAAPRCGTALADDVDGVFPAGKGKKWVYFRVRLAG